MNPDPKRVLSYSTRPACPNCGASIVITAKGKAFTQWKSIKDSVKE